MISVADIKSQKEERDGVCYIDVLSCPYFRITGLPWLKTNGNYHRIDDRLEGVLSEGLKIRSNNTSGVQVSFKTNSNVFSVHIVRDKPEFMEHMTDDATGGTDIYIGSGKDKKFWHVCYCFNREKESLSTFSTDGKMHEYTVNFPLYSGIEKFEIGLSCSADVDFPSEFSVKNPVLVYGSSITQGGCCTRPGLLYTNMIGRILDVETVCMGFSSNARGEEYMAKAFSELPLSAFVMDYDWNAPDAEWLRKTHKKFFDIIRSAQPDLPVIIVSKCDYDDDPVSGEERRKVILKTYETAVNNGDKNVYFVDGKEIFGHDFFRGECTVDRNHPSDIGHMRLAVAISDTLKKALGI